MSFWALAAAAASLQSCPILCDPIDGSPSGSPVPGIIQARTLEWVAISFSNAWKWKVKVKSLSHVRLSATPWTTAYQALLSMGFSRQEYWSGLPLPSPSGLSGDPYLLSFNHFETLVKWINIVSQWPMILLCFKTFLIFLTNFPKYQNLTKAFSASSWLWDTSKEHLWDISKRKVKLSLLDMLITSKSLSNGWRRTLGYRIWINATNVDFPKFMWNH